MWSTDEFEEHYLLRACLFEVLLPSSHPQKLIEINA